MGPTARARRFEAEFQYAVVDVSVIVVGNEAAEVGVPESAYAVDAPGRQPGFTRYLVSVKVEMAGVLVVHDPQALVTLGPGDELAVEHLLIRIPALPPPTTVVDETIGPPG